MRSVVSYSAAFTFRIHQGMSDKQWHIVGWDGSEKIFETHVRLGYFSENQIQRLLMCLAAKSGLTFEEIVGAYSRRKTRLANDLLLCQKDGPGPAYYCGDKPCFTARVVSVQK